MKDWKEIERIFQLALEEPPEKREALLERETLEAEVVESVKALLSCHSEAASFLESPVLEAISDQPESPGGSPFSGLSSARNASDPEESLETIGRVFGRYRILEKLGQGGMGEVYLAEDISLERKVALKFLPALLKEDETARKRFLREARTIAALDHPYICHIHEVGETEDGRDFIAMEYIEGPSLKQYLSGPILPLKETLRLALEVAEALEKAHKAGIIHRDLKPANIMLTPEGHAKVMDFGLAKRVIGKLASSTEPSSELTHEGVAIGTLAYMSPEQIQALPLDHRTDIFSLGIVLYEMLTRVHPFRRESSLQVAAAILSERPPQLSRHREGIPRDLRKTVEQMLEKNPERRPRSILEVKQGLYKALEALESSPTLLWRRLRAGLPWNRVLPWALVPVAAVLGVATTRLLLDGPAPHSPFGIRSEFLLPENQRLTHWFRHGIALSPDGRHLAFVADDSEQDFRSQSYWRPRHSMIFLRRLDQWSVQALPGTANAYQPVFSPDGRWLCFVQMDPESERYFLRKIDLDGGEATTLCETDQPFGACWGPSGIIFAEKTGGLLRVSANGGIPERITGLDPETREISHRLPHLLPGNSGVIYTSVRDPNPHWSQTPSWIHSFETGKRQLILKGGSDVRYVSSGHLLFASQGDVLAVPFDVDGLKTTGDPVTVLDGVSHSVHTGGEWQEVGAAQFDVTEGGLLAYIPGSVFPEPRFSVAWVDRQGRVDPLEIEPRKYVRARVSPDGLLLLLAHFYVPGGLWAYDLEREILRRQTFGGPAALPVWGPGPGQFTVSADSSGALVKQLDSGPEDSQRIPAGSQPGRSFMPADWSPDGKWLIGVSFPGPADLLLLSAAGNFREFLSTRYDEDFPDFSPDGNWLAYCSNESGRREVYVRPFPGPGPVTQISRNGGLSPAWSPDQTELYFRADPDRFQAVRIHISGNHLEAGQPEYLFEGHYPDAHPIRSWDVAPNGRFLMLRDMESSEWSAIFETAYPDRIRFELNWLEELEQTVPTR